MEGMHQASVLGTGNNLHPTQPKQVTTTTEQPDNASSTQNGFSLVDAYAVLGSRSNLVTDIVLGSNNQIAQIRVVDSVTHQVVGTSPPETIARIQQEMQAYQDVAKSKNSTSTTE